MDPQAYLSFCASCLSGGAQSPGTPYTNLSTAATLRSNMASQSLISPVTRASGRL